MYFHCQINVFESLNPWLYRFEIWLVPRQYCCRSTWQISQQSYHFEPFSRSFEVWRLNVLWLEALMRTCSVWDCKCSDACARFVQDDVIKIKWKHFPRYWPFVRGIHQTTVNSPHKGQWRRALIFFICAWTNGLGKQRRRRWIETPSRQLWRHCNYLNSTFVRNLPLVLARLYSRKVSWPSGRLYIKLFCTLNSYLYYVRYISQLCVLVGWRRYSQ